MTTVSFLLFPLFALFLFRVFRLPVALSATIVGGYLLLPTRGGLDIPGLQPIDKNSLPAIMALILAAIHGRNAPDTRPGWLPASPLILALIALLLVGRIATFLTNGDPQIFGWRILPSLTIYDTLARLQGLVFMLVPFILARKYLATPEAHRDLLVVIAVAGLMYTLPALYEVRMSPQLNNIIYGYFPHDWLQHIRRGGFRPVVFLNHGLLLGIFLACAILAAAGMARVDRGDTRTLWLFGALWLVFALYMAKSLGAFATSVLLLPVALFAPPRLKVLIAASIGMVIATYPMLRGAGWVPLEQITDLFRSISAERTGSFVFRLNNEDLLLARANERPLFGWGGWGRSLIYDETGRNTSIVDGYWIIVIGVGGWVQYIGEFGLLCFAMLVLALRRRSFDIAPATAALSIVLAVNLIDLIPNSGITVVTWIMAGALAGRLELGRATDRSLASQVANAAAAPAGRPSGPVLARTTTGFAPRYRRELGGALPEAASPLPDGPEARRAAGRGARYARDLGARDPKTEGNS
ncbi:MAG: hypothetical protein MUF73_02130 [Rhodobacteraceae bacterium]|jgi:hypothetical protein|nr:hypothetical protein [Paracoccaceae bacterium]